MPPTPARWRCFVGIGAIVLFGLVAALAIALSRSIANPLRRLTSAATTVADLADTELTRVTDSEESDEQVPQLPPIDVTTSDEVGQLAAAFNRVQSTATMLVERQAVRRNNVSLMFANVAQRTQNLVGRQLALVDELERNEQDGRLLASLYRLDHLSTRLRRTADNLLVVAGSRGETRISRTHRADDRAAVRAGRDRGLPAGQARQRQRDHAERRGRAGHRPGVRRAAGQRDVLLATASPSSRSARSSWPTAPAWSASSTTASA